MKQLTQEQADALRLLRRTFGNLLATSHTLRLEVVKLCSDEHPGGPECPICALEWQLAVTQEALENSAKDVDLFLEYGPCPRSQK